MAPHNWSLRLLPEGRYDEPRLYAILFEDGQVKIGMSRSPRARALRYATGRDARPIRRFHVFGLVRKIRIYDAERLALSLAADCGVRLGSTEYFEGLDFTDALKCVRQALQITAEQPGA